MILRMMYVLPMMLGRTYDMKNNSVGVDIFPEKEVNNPRISEEPFFHSNFKTLETLSEVKDVLDISGDLSLSIKAGTFAFRGMGAYVKESLQSENSVDILTKVSFRTVAKSLSHSANPIPSWLSYGRENLGTHFVQTIIYGGDLIASVRFRATHSEDLQDIRGTVKASLESGSALDLVTEGKLEMLEKELNKTARMEIDYFATVPVEGVPHTIEGFRDLVRNFESHVMKVNGGLGSPVEVELEELSTLDEGFDYLKNSMIDIELKFFEEYLDDLLSTKSRLKTWIDKLPENLTADQEKTIASFSDRLSDVIGIFIDTIANLDLEGGVEQLDDAVDAYDEGAAAVLGKFRREFTKLVSNFEVPKPKNENTGSSIYVHYGSTDCVADSMTSTIYSGYVASAPRNASGSGYNYLCFPLAPEKEEIESFRADETASLISGIKYGLFLDKPSEIKGENSVLRGVVCSVCLVKERTSLVTFMGQSKCPDKAAWSQQYEGFLMSSDVNRAENICVDSKLGSHKFNSTSADEARISFVQASLDQKTLQFVPCVVCTN